MHELPEMEGVVVTGATVQKDMAKIDLINVDNKPGNAAKIFAALAKAKVVVNDIMQTEVRYFRLGLRQRGRRTNQRRG